MTDLLNGLNAPQRAAVLTTRGPILIVAGAGAGKTKTITHRIGHLISSGVPPESILAITFTNKAAREMRERVFHLIGREGVSAFARRGAPWIGTFHALGIAILREHGEAIGVSRNANILDTDDARKLVRDAVKKCGYDPKEMSPDAIAVAISRSKNDLKDPDEIGKELQDPRKRDAYGHIYAKYEQLKNESRALDFDDLLVKTVRLLEQKREVHEAYLRRWKYIHVDEYQDTNPVQYRMIRLLTGPGDDICVVGDHDQNIYQWRGASLANILNFEHDFPGAKVVMLEQNYRSTKTIIAAANDVIAKNTQRKEKVLFSEREKGEPILYISAFDERDEAQKIAEHIGKLIEGGASPRDIVVLYRNNFQSRAIEESLLYAGIPYQVLGTRFYDRKEVKDVLAYIRAAIDPQDLVDIARAINEPPRGIGAVTLEKVLTGNVDALPLAARNKVRVFYEILEKIRAAALVQPPSQLVMTAITESGIAKYLKEEDEEERLGNVYELVAVAKRYDVPVVEGEIEVDQLFGIRQMMEDIALEGDQDRMKNEDSVRLMTVHASKGLEFDYVFVTGMEEGLFPSERSKTAQTLAEREEERRLFYVALTRAAKRVFLSSASARMVFGKRDFTTPSSFIEDIDPELIQEDERPKEKFEKPKKKFSLLDDPFADDFLAW